MRLPRFTRPAAGVAGATLTLLALAGLLAFRLVSRDAGTAFAAPPGPAEIPDPKPVVVSALDLPCWACKEAEAYPLRFRSDLDQLAPLGTGKANAAVWFGAFALPDGPRAGEGRAALARAIDVPGVGKALPADDPLLLEAAPWCDQATMRFYPDVFPLEGLQTKLANLQLALTLSRSWVARGRKAASAEEALADYRRVVRLGRLLRQEDTVLINDLVGLAAIRMGAEAIYDAARSAGRLDLALAAAVVAGEAAPQRLLTASRVTSVEVRPYVKGKALELPPGYVESVRAVASGNPDRRFRGEALMTLHVMAGFASEADRSRALEATKEVAAGADPVLASLARWNLGHPATAKDLEDLSEPIPR